MAYEILRAEIPLEGTPLEDRYRLNCLSFKELDEAGFSRQSLESGLLEHVGGGNVIFPVRGEKIPRAVVIATAKPLLDEAYQSFLRIIKNLKR